MKQTIKMLLCAALSAALLLTVSCGSKPGQPSDTKETETETATEPAETEPETEDPTDYDALGRVPFANLTPAPEDAFTVSPNATGVTVERYTGAAETVRIPDRIGGKPVTALADGAFRDCKTVHVLWIPDSVVTFGKEILVGTDTLYALRTPLPTGEGQRFIGWLFGAETYERNNMADLRRIDFLEIGGNPTSIPAYTFFDCNDLVTVRLPESVTELGAFAFARCASLKVLDVSRIKRLGEGALLGCTSVRELTFGAGLESVGREALGNCNALRRLTLPFVGESRTEHRFLGWLFGAETAELSAGLYPSGLRELTLTEGVGTLAPAALYAAPVVTLTVGAGLTEIGARAFADCTRLRELTLPAGLTKIGDNAFSGCTALTGITLPEGVTALGVNAFLQCTALNTVILPGSLTALQGGTFMGCRRLAEVKLGGVRTVGINAFRGCGALVSVVAQGEVTFAAGNEAAAARLSGS